MNPRPQFSLRMLLLLMVLVSLGATTVAELPENQKLATAAQGVIRIVLCVALPAALLAGAVAKPGYERTMYVGGLFAASVPLLTAFAMLYAVIFSEGLQTHWERAHGFLDVLWLLRRAFAVSWVLIPCASLICLLAHWLWRQGAKGGETGMFSILQIGMRIAVAGAAAIFATSLAVRTTHGHPWLADAQNALVVMVTVVFPALLVIGAIEASGPFRAFCLGAALPSAYPLIVTCRSLSGSIAKFDSPTEWSVTLACLSAQRFWLIGTCVCAPLFGLACVCCHRLLQRCAAHEEDGGADRGWSKNSKRLLLASAIACLIVLATIQVPEERHFAVVAQEVHRLALCIAFSAALLAGSVVTRGDARALCIGGLFAASGPLVALVEPSFIMIANHWLQATPDSFDAISRELPFLRKPFAVLWALVSCVALLCCLVRRLWRQDDATSETATLQASAIAYRAASTAAAALIAAAVAVGIRSHGLLADFQKPLMAILTVAFPALLILGAVEGTGRFRSFCIGGAVPVAFALVLLCMWLGRNAFFFDTAADWSSAVASLAQKRNSTAALWACAPVVGLAAGFFHRFFERR